MSGPATRRVSETEQAIAAQFQAQHNELPGNATAADLRKERFDAFVQIGLPTRRIESWHYTDLRAVMRAAYALAAPPDADALAEAKEALASLPAAQNRIVLVDGGYRSDLGGLAAGHVTVTDLAVALGAADAALTDALVPAQGRGDAALDLNAAMMSGGIVVDVAPGAFIDAPVEIVSIATRQSDTAFFVRNLVRAGEGARVSIVERHISLGAAGLQANDALIVHAAQGAQVSHAFCEKADGNGLAHVNSLVVSIGAEARFSSFALIDSGGFVRRQAFVQFNGPDASLELSGLSLVRGKDHIDTTLVVGHIHPGCTSKEYFKQIVDESGTGVFQGKVSVAPEAQKTDGAMKSQTILLGESAAMYNKPELEIFADDVACSHGATCGSLDPNQLFYAMARGLPRGEAEALLLEAFGSDAIEHLPDEALREDLLQRLRAWLTKRIT